MMVAGHALYFERDHQVAVVPYQAAMNVPEVTLEAWIKVEPNERFYSYVVSRNYGDLGYGIALHGRPTKVFSQAESIPVPIGVWTHVALVASVRSHKFYVNGELASAAERSGPLKPFEHPLMIGNSNFFGYPGNEPTGFRGWIDELRIWSKPRTQLQIKQTMNRRLRGSERNLLAYFPFDEGKGQIVHDYSGHLISGSLGGSFQEDGDDPSWSPGVDLKGAIPRLRQRR